MDAKINYEWTLQTFLKKSVDGGLLFMAGDDDRSKWPTLASSDEPAAIYWKFRELSEAPKELLAAAGDLMAAKIDMIIEEMGMERGKVRLAPVPLGSIGLTVATSISSDIPFLMLRDKEKDHGTGGKIVGKYEKGQHLWLIEDVATSGGSTEKEAARWREDGIAIENALVLCDRKGEAEDFLKGKGITLHSCFTQDVALEQEYLKNHPNYGRVMSWLQEERWPKKR